MSDIKKIHHNNCQGGNAVEEADGTYCMGRVDQYIDSRDIMDECKSCPRHYDIDKYIYGGTECLSTLWG